ncbi:MAG: MtrB/PioB family outer membrane beta-barrel protein [Vicinamibacterales bacterium]|nr:MtrB/PioB family outer membrane beta-barrel protein [Vicinamibacterales bacterium]
MRNRVMSVTAALLLASATVAMAQATAEKGPGGASPVSGTIDVGFRTGSVTGDEARLERYRDLRNGAYTNISFGKETETYVFNLGAQNVGYRDQRYALDFANSKVTVGASWNSTPLNYCDNCLTPWVESAGNVWTLDAAARTAVQSRVPGVLGIANNYSTSQQVSIYRGLAKPFELQQRRDVAAGALTYAATADLGLTVGVSTTRRTGYQPFGMAFAFNNANELPLQIDDRTNEVSAAVEWTKPKGMFRAAVEHSMFANEFNAIEWDNPLRATDFSNGLLPPSGPWDNSAYSNGNSAARGRMSAWPDNSMTTVSFMGLYKLPRRTTINGTVAVIQMGQNDDLIPWTTNSVINQPLVWSAFPNLAQLERPTAEQKVRAVNALMNLTSRPTRKVGFQLKYRHNTHANMSRLFNSTQFVRLDGVPYAGGSETHPHSVVRDTVDAAVSFSLPAMTTLRVGYGYDNFSRTGRAHNDVRDNALRATVDTVGNQYLSLRVGYEMVNRKGFGFSIHSIEDSAGQPGLRFYDEADRDRNRANVGVTLTPTDTINVTASMSYGKDEYGGPGLEFGLLDNKNTSYNVGVNFMPVSTMSFGANVGRDEYNAFQKSRNANPAPDPSWRDPNRDWTMTNDEAVNNFDVYVDLLRAITKTDIRIAYMFSDSDNAFLFGGPRIPVLAAVRDANGFNTFEALPNVTNKWQQLSADVKVQATEKIGFAVTYYYERLDISDFATINIAGTDQPRIDYLGGLTTGYGNRPYKGSTGVFRILYFF